MVNSKYTVVKNRMLVKWRKRILERDHYRCRSCGGSYNLQCCHITDAVDFQRLCSHCGGVIRSFRYDNLVTLCKDCHKSYHWIARKKQSCVNHYTYLRARKVFALFNSLKKERGYDVVPSELIKNKELT